MTHDPITLAIAGLWFDSELRKLGVHVQRSPRVDTYDSEVRRSQDETWTSARADGAHRKAALNSRGAVAPSS